MGERILVVMPNWFGETLFTTPFLRALRSAKPDAFVVALGVERACEVLRGNPCVDEVVGFEPSLMGLPLIGRLRSLRFDAGIVLRRSLTRSLLLRGAGIPRRIGFANPKSGWLLTDRVPASAERRHKAFAYLPLLGPLGIALDGAPHSYEYYPTAEDRQRAQNLLRQFGVDAARPVIVLHPGANWAHKRWSAERFAQLAERLRGDHTVLITGSQDDRSLIDDVAQRMTTQPVRLDGQTTLRELAACLERATVVVSNDTGVLHIAAALRRPLVALYGPTSPAITGPLGDPARIIVVHHEGCCPSIPCFHPNHPGYPGMYSITVDEVYEAVRRLLHKTSDYRPQTSGKEVTGV